MARSEWILRDARGTEIARHEGLGRCLSILYWIDREARRALCASVLANDDATTHTAGGYTLTRGEG